MKSNPASRRSILLGAAFSALILIIVAWNLDYGSLIQILRRVQLPYLLLALAFYFLNYALRGWRLRLMVPDSRVSYHRLVALNGIYGMYNYLLPAKTGELSFVVLATRWLGAPLPESAALLLLLRYLDLVAIAIFQAIFLVFSWTTVPAWLVAASLGFCGAVLLAGVILRWLADPLRAPRLQPPSSCVPWVARVLQAIYALLGALLDALQKVAAQRHMRPLLVLTVVIWACINMSFFLIIIALGYQLSYVQVIVISSIMLPLSFLPIQGFANLGTHELAWVLAFSLFNLPQAAALDTAVSSHVIVLAFVLLLGAVSSVATLLPGNGS